MFCLLNLNRFYMNTHTIRHFTFLLWSLFLRNVKISQRKKLHFIAITKLWWSTSIHDTLSYVSKQPNILMSDMRATVVLLWIHYRQLSQYFSTSLVSSFWIMPHEFSRSFESVLSIKSSFKVQQITVQFVLFNNFASVIFLRVDREVNWISWMLDRRSFWIGVRS